jgi:hypothetical protein
MSSTIDRSATFYESIGWRQIVSRKKSAIAVANALLVLSMAHYASAEVIEIPRGVYSISNFGSPGIGAMGQTFLVGDDHYLNSFALYISAYGEGNPLKFRGYLASWDGGKASEILYVSDTRTAFDNDLEQRFVFDTGSLNLTSGAKYVAFLSVAGVDNAYSGLYSPRMANMDPYSNAYPDGDMVYLFDGGNYEALTTQPWSCLRFEPVPAGCERFDLQFDAVLSASPVPEPADSLMLGAGLAGFASVRMLSATRRRARPITQGKEPRLSSRDPAPSPAGSMVAPPYSQRLRFGAGLGHRAHKAKAGLRRLFLTL